MTIEVGIKVDEKLLLEVWKLGINVEGVQDVAYMAIWIGKSMS